MNYLALCKKVHLILRIGDDTPGTQPAAIAGQTGVPAEIVQWVAAAHDDICRSQIDWDFMRGSASFTLSQGSNVIAKATMLATAPTLGRAMAFTGNDYAFAGLTPVGVSGAAEDTVGYIHYSRWPGNYDVPPLAIGSPRCFTIKPDGSLEFDAVADRDYSIRLPFRAAVVPLTADASEPMFDADYHNTIVWWAIVHYYCPSRDNTMELRNKAAVELQRELMKMRNDLLPDFTLS